MNVAKGPPSSASSHGTVSFGNNFTKRVDILVYPEEFHHWLEQIRECAEEAGLREHLDDAIARPADAGLKQAVFDKERALLNSLIFDSVKLQDEVAKTLNQNLSIASPKDVVAAVRRSLVRPAFYYQTLNKFMQFWQLNDGEDDPVLRLRLLQKDWDYIKACDMGTSDDVYVSVVQHYLGRTVHGNCLRDELLENEAYAKLKAEDVRDWLKKRFQLSEL
ncbi:hypothetical protein JDV02_005073 [Purpureocillium takamizusanense]|uniref:Uncharacterized protein n=1 Tax=Purpureocillium takamizusanense TaxID=2060973 RepID=A0A9Q8VBH8_9HYPO|nr:uncharacterized protein JDV02_005073 [Purpureocillium takamizusanense]UNI18827.1 hypothetical protein JDV02_005073 [Purpureocillium takamizusanense]